MTTRISLKEASRQAPRILERGDSQLLEEGAPPTLSDLAGALQFALGDGRIWLNDERMVLMQTSMLGHIRWQMIKEIGMERTRIAMMRTGWMQGVYLANLVSKRFKQDDVTAALAAGPRLHTMEGYAKVTVNQFEFDIAKRAYSGEFYWYDSTEGVEHLHNLGVCDCPVCWMQIAAPSGFTSTLLGYPVIFRELDCVGQGARRCVVVGKDAAGWDDDVPELEIFGLGKENRKKSEPWKPSANLGRSRKPTSASEVIGKSPLLMRARRQLEKVAASREPVMLLGEPGTGKAHFARHLHAVGAAPNQPFISVNCGLFEPGGGGVDKPLFGQGGLMEQAKGGTIFLNDILSLPLPLQAKLAAHMQDRDDAKRPTRIVSASNETLLDAVGAGQMRSDLYYSLSLLPVHIPPLRERRDDLPDLIAHFFDLYTYRHRKTLKGLSAQVLDVLLRYDFPGNLRELSNMIERGVLYSDDGGQVELSHVFTGIEKPPAFAGQVQQDGELRRSETMSEMGDQRTLEAVERETLLNALDACGWNVSAAARTLGISRAKLDYRIRRLKLTAPK